MEALTLNRETYLSALEEVNEAVGETDYLSMFTVTFPDGINTANTLELCRAIQTPTTENKVRLLKICIEGKNFCMSNVNDGFDGFPIFQKEPLALLAIADALYGHILKKYVRLSKPKEAAAQKA